MLKNKVMKRQFINIVAFVNYVKMLYMFKTFVSLLSGHSSDIWLMNHQGE